MTDATSTSEAVWEQEVEVATIVGEVWCDVLGVPVARDHDDFFELGGNSMRAATLVERIEGRLGVRVPMDVLLCHSCLHAVVAACIEIEVPGGDR